MSFQIPQKATGNVSSEIRIVLEKGKEIPGFISLAIGNPAKEAIPVENISEAAAKIMESSPMEILQYGPATGCLELKEWIIDRMSKVKNMPSENHSVLITNGSSQVLGLMARCFTEMGDEVYAEAFSYPNALNAIRCSGAVVKGIPMDEKGMLPSELEKAAQSGKGRYIYINPTFQNPTGFTMPLDRRKEIYEVAKTYDLLILEDDPYEEIRFKGEPVPSFKSIDDAGIVLYAGSFSKTLSAGLRVGFVYGEQKYIDAMASVKGCMDGEIAQYTQKIVHYTVTHMDYEEHLKEIQKIYGDKCNAMREILLSECSEKVKLSNPEGGMFIWADLPEGTDMDLFSEKLFEHAVGAVRSAAFSSIPSIPGYAFRLNYTALPTEMIKEGARRFAEVTRELC
jgi:2-aminoadipate transaminase